MFESMGTFQNISTFTWNRITLDTLDGFFFWHSLLLGLDGRRGLDQGCNRILRGIYMKHNFRVARQG
jgi:hypothetical protein